MIYGERIRQARVSRAYDIEELSALTDIPRYRLGRFEIGREEPTKAELHLLANTLKYDLSFFSKKPARKGTMSAIFF